MKHRPFETGFLTPSGGHRLVGSLAGAARPRKNIKGAQRLAQPRQKLGVECKGKS